MTQSNRSEVNDALSRERERTLGLTLKRYASSIWSHELEAVFERLGCSCYPFRQKLSALEGEYDARKKAIDEKYHADLQGLRNSELYLSIEQVRQEVQDIDRREHPRLNQQADQAYNFLPIWLMDQLREGNDQILRSSSGEICRSYAESWMGGWRPRSLRAKAEREAVP